MKNRLRALSILPVWVLSLAPLSALQAQEAPVLPSAKTQNGVTYLSGGVGEGQAAAMKAAAANYPVMLTFADPGGAYLADVKVTISDQKGHPVLNTVSKGPMLLVDLPPGQYRLNAEYKGNTQSQALSVKSKTPTRLTLRWPS